MRFLRRRPSPAIVISSVALFMSLGGVGYAATQLPHNSVGSYQLRNGAVSYNKIQPGAVGDVRANTKQLQERVWKVCGTNQVMFGVNQNGDPKCFNNMPPEVGTTSNTAAVKTDGTAATVTSATLATGNDYLALANPTVTVTPATGATTGQTVSVSCTLTVGSNTSTRTITVHTNGKTNPGSAALPLQQTGTGGTTAVSCTAKPVGLATGATAPTVSVISAVNAIQIS